MRRLTVRIFFLFLFFTALSGPLSAQVTAAHNNNLEGESDRIVNAFETRDWSTLARLQKERFMLDKNPSRLIWAARCNLWLKDTSVAFFYLDTAVKSGYANIYVLDSDTAFHALRGLREWKELRQRAGERYEIQERPFFWGYYYGALAIILVLNLYLFFSTKEYSYLFLSMMIVSDMHLELFNNSSFKIFATRLLPWLAPAMANRFPPPTFYVAALMIFYLLFSKTFLGVRKHAPRLVPVFRAAIFVFACIIAMRFLGTLLPDAVVESMVAISFLISAVTGVVLWKRGLSESIHFMTAAAVITLGFFLNNYFMVIVYSPFSIGMLLAFTILTLGIGNKVRLMRIEKERAQEKALEVLEERVKERTIEVVAQKDEILKQKSLVEEKQKEILDSITYAKRLQDAILPPAEFISRYLPENFILYVPKDIVAGDFYWAEEHHGRFYIACADSTGHGVPGAMVSVVCSNAMKQSLKEYGLSDPGKIFDKTRELVIETFEKSGADVKDGMDASLLCVDRQNRKVLWSGANNPLWYLQDNTLMIVQADKQPIGKTYQPKPFTTHQFELQEGTIYYLFTDGLADQFGGPKGKKFKYKQFEELLVSVQHKPMKEQLGIVLKRFEDWKDGQEQVDDVCVIGIKI